MKKILVLFLLIIATVLPTLAADWVQTGNKSYIDINSIERDSNRYHVFSYWTKVLNNGRSDFKFFEQKFNKKIWYIMYKKVIDFDTNSYIIVEMDFYDLNNKLIDFYALKQWKEQQEYYEQYLEALSYYTRNYNDIAQQSYNEERRLAALAAMTNAPGLNNMAGRYNQLNVAENKLALMKQAAIETYNDLPWKRIMSNSAESVEYYTISKMFHL